MPKLNSRSTVIQINIFQKGSVMNCSNILVMTLILLMSTFIQSQNLVPNPSFEEIKDTTSRFTANNFDFSKKIKLWSTPNTSSPDLITPDFHEKFITPPPAHSGQNVVGIQAKPNYCEYIGITLKETLKPNHTYLVEYWIRRSYCISPKMNKDQKMSENFGILFTSEEMEFDHTKMIEEEPQIKGDSNIVLTSKDWIKVSKYFSPTKTYTYFYLGQFQGYDEDSYLKGYYVIDDILIKELKYYQDLDKEVKLDVGNIIPLNHIHFALGSTRLASKNSHSHISEMVDYLKYHSEIRVKINGHTDSSGNRFSNQRLSKRRAKAIADLIIRGGIRSHRIEWEGFGEDLPIADNDSSEGRALNRRVEFEVVE